LLFLEIPGKQEKSRQERIKNLQESINNLQESIKNLQGSKKNDSKSASEEPMETFIDIHNVFCSFKVRCPLDLADILERGYNVELKKNRKYIIMKLKQPKFTAKIWPSGKILCMGAKSEKDSKINARRIARLLQKLGYNVVFSNFTIHNCHGSVLLPFHIKIVDFCKVHREASYEPELHSGVIYKVPQFQATLTPHRTGSLIALAPSEEKIRHAVEQFLPMIVPFAVTSPKL
jgi:transcription initiation factor TFIID TATA-box-binding protein